MTLQSVGNKTVAILGGGITGLAAAYYLKKECKFVTPVILEKSPRLGGWVQTLYKNDGPNDRFQYECGPRTIRPAGMSGMNTLDLLEEIGMQNQVQYVTREHPAAKNRFLFVNGKITKLPTDMSILFQTTPPFEKPLLFAGLRDLFKTRQKLDDDTIYNFVSRRFGEDVAKYTIDPIIRGVSAGDSKQISVKFMMKQLFEYEQKNGSVVYGYLKDMFQEWRTPSPVSPEEQTIGFSNIALCSLKEKWSVWTLENGLQTLTEKLEDILVSQETQILKNCDIQSIKLDRGGADIEYTQGANRSSLQCSHVICTMPAHAAGQLLRPNNDELGKWLDTILSIDVDVTNVMYKDEDVIHRDYDGFGFLVPSIEKSVPGLLGVVFDTCCFPQGDRTILTVMSYPQSKSEEAIKSYLEKTLKIKRSPDDFHTQRLVKCIPQYTIGHYDRIQNIRDIIQREQFPLTMIGASFDGVSVNDCIYSGKKAADAFVNKMQQSV